MSSLLKFWPYSPLRWLSTATYFRFAGREPASKGIFWLPKCQKTCPRLRGQIWLVNSPRGLFYKPITILVLFQSWIGKKLSRTKLSGLSAESLIKLKLTTSKHNQKNIPELDQCLHLWKSPVNFQKIHFLFFKCHSPWTLWRFEIKWVNYHCDNLHDFAQVFVI